VASQPEKTPHGVAASMLAVHTQNNHAVEIRSAPPRIPAGNGAKVPAADTADICDYRRSPPRRAFRRLGVASDFGTASASHGGGAIPARPPGRMPPPSPRRRRRRGAVSGLVAGVPSATPVSEDRTGAPSRAWSRSADARARQPRRLSRGAAESRDGLRIPKAAGRHAVPAGCALSV